jgi:uncharacterized coiled-coil protein SlyX
MRTARMTVLMTDAEKAEIEADAARLGVSSGEYVRLAVDNFEMPTAAEEAELAALVAEVNIAIPKMRASLDRMCTRMEVLHEEMDSFLREKGIRK